MKWTLILGLLALVVLVNQHGSSAAGIDSMLSDDDLQILKKGLEEADFDEEGFRSQMRAVGRKAMDLGRRAVNGVKRGVRSGCQKLNQMPQPELAYRVSAGFSDLVDEEGYEREEFVKDVIDAVKFGCKMMY